MDKLMTLPSATPATKHRAVGSAGMDQDVRELAINTAKSVVGIDSSNRRIQGVLGQVALVDEHHPYLEPIKKGAKAYEQEKQATTTSEERSQLVPSHVRAWIELVNCVRADKSVPDKKKTALIAYHTSQSDINAVGAHVITCFQKKCYRQKAWGDKDRFKIELLVIPEVRTVATEIMNAIALKPEVEIEKGAAEFAQNSVLQLAAIEAAEHVESDDQRAAEQAASGQQQAAQQEAEPGHPVPGDCGGPCSTPRARERPRAGKLPALALMKKAGGQQLVGQAPRGSLERRIQLLDELKLWHRCGRSSGTGAAGGRAANPLCGGRPVAHRSAEHGGKMSSRKAPTQLYSNLSPEQQAKFQDVVVEQLKTLIGGHRELSVLAEYIAVMLQSSRPPEQIESELEAFLQEQSKPFTAWLCKELSKLTGGGKASSSRAADAKGEALLLRAVQDARQGAAAEPEVGKRSRREKRPKEGAAAAEAAAPVRERRRASSGGVGAAAAAAAANVAEQPAGRHRGEARSRSRQRRRREAQREAAAGSGAAASRKALLTPNVQFLRDAYHSKVDAQAAEPPPPPDSRWTFRADASAPGAEPPRTAPEGLAPAGYALAPGAPAVPAAAPAPQVTVVRNKFFPAKKWKVARKDTVVRATEHLDSEKVQLLQVGEIVEQVAPAFKLNSGIVRIQIRHPSSPQFPNPIGWVTQDATAAGGPRFLVPGPEPMVKSGWRPPAAAPAWGEDPSAGWWPPAKGKGRGKGAPAPAARPAAAGGRGGGQTFSNLTWTPKPDEAAPAG
ncbi:unnamed protein product [Prorocentrum cordatum]|uniref:PWI domain-containing protein n=1 Tax=Prorocentrum cordatum TaxID=2364126 RepID=A0ABN9UAF0_9DINO|nr:unnamed protein product [Polarella glacialis]